MKEQAPTNKFDIIELLKNSFPEYKITFSNYDFAKVGELDDKYDDFRPRPYVKGKSIIDIGQTIYITKNFFIRASVTIRFFYSNETIMTDNFKCQNNVIFGNQCFINTKDIAQETFDKMYSSYNTKQIWVSSNYPKNLDFLKNIISSNLKNEIEKILKLKYGESLDFYV